jgi:hypothetical protein
VTAERQQEITNNGANNGGWNLSVDFETAKNRVTPIVTLR